MAKRFDFQAARKSGYSDSEISSYLGESHPDFDVQGAIQSGYSPEEINEYLSEKLQPSRPKSIASAAFRGLVKGASRLNPLDVGPIPHALGEKSLEETLPSQQKGAERLVERAGELVAPIAAGPEGIGLKGLQLAGGALAGHAAEESGLGKLGQFTSELIGMSFPGLAKSLGLKLGSLLKKGPTSAAGEIASETVRLKPEQIKEGVREAANRLGVLEELPLSAQVDSPIIQGTETKLMQSMTGAPLQKKLEGLGEKLTEEYKGIAKSLSERENLLPSIVSEEAVNALKNIESQNERAFRSLYDQASKMLPETAVTLPKVGMAIHKVIDSTLKKLQSALGTPSKDALVKRLERLKNSWSSTEALREGAIPIHELETLKRDLNQVIKYEIQGGVDKLLKGLFGVVKEGIQTYGRNYNRPYLNRFNQAEKLFSENAETFRKNPLLKSLVLGKHPEQVFGKEGMGSVRGIGRLENLFGKSPEGKETFDALKRYKLEDVLNKKLLDKNGSISWGKAAGAFKEPKTRDLVLKLVGPEQFKKLKDLSAVASGVEEGFKKFLNTSKTAVTASDLALLGVLPIKAVQQLFSGNVLGAAKTVGAILVPNQLSRLIANPKFVDAAISAAKAGKGKSAEKFIQSMQRVARLTAAEMLKESTNPEIQEEEQEESLEG